MGTEDMRSREDRARGRLEGNGFVLCETHGRDPHELGSRKFVVFDMATRDLVDSAGASYCLMTLDEVEELVELYADVD